MRPQRPKRRRGNVLITAIFMAIFLFFLSVALVSQNRMDINLGLSVDHRLKAEAAARAGINFALQTMRTAPNWEAILQDPGPSLDSGATFTVEVRAPHDRKENPYTLMIVSTGVSGLVKVEQWAAVEEFRKTPEGQDGPAQLFTRAIDKDEAPNDLAMLGSDFQWYVLGPLPRGDTPMEADGGPLFVFAPEGTAQPPPSLMDRLPLYLDTGELQQGPVVRIELVAPGEHLLMLKIEDGEGTWEDIPDPGVQLGRSAGMVEVNDENKDFPVIRIWEDPKDLPDDRPPWDRRNVRLRGTSRGDSGFDIFTVSTEVGTWDEATAKFQVRETDEDWQSVYDAAKTPSELTLDWETLVGPQLYLEWYSLQGKALSARGGKITCQGLHTFYGHYPTADLKWPALGTPAYESIVYQKPCILEYDIKTKKWSKIVDLMEVTHLEFEPRLFSSPKWKPDFLEIDSKDRAFVQTDSTPPRVLRFDTQKQYENQGAVVGVVPRVTLYRDRLYQFETMGMWDPSNGNDARYGLRDFHGKALDPNSELGVRVAPVTGVDGLADNVREVQLRPQEQIQVGMNSVLATGIATWGNDLVVSGLVRRDIEPAEMPAVGFYNGYKKHDLNPSTAVRTLLRYDGQGWQAWPGGVEDALRIAPREQDTEKMIVYSLTGQKIRLVPTQLALGSYEDDLPSLRRYAVLAAGEGVPPTLPGFEEP